MKYDCSNEFDLNLIYQKLISPSHSVEMVKACDFFSRNGELELLQAKMAVLLKTAKPQPVTLQRRK